ncbi:hypothetical protein B0A50_00140 [Salinomyces thailandicus]|uniref:EF-hand domain-containing protein n=1 Tax=Salinomyces thailandicus TaxID=706561 RepID=A0A4U0UF34_9PEZI|nr:hypothetical protein B0A50_00140 [Salinomyces thailandica]
MATSTTAPPFPSRPYASGLGRNTPFNNPQPGSFGAPPAQQSSGTYGGTGFGGGGNALGGGSAAATQQQREAQRLERERAERADRERREADERVALDALSEEQREEVNEAFSLFDLDKDAHIDYHELKVALKALGFDLAKTDILAILQTYGVPASQLPNANNQQQSNSRTPATQVPTFTGPSRLLLSHAAFQIVAAQRIGSRDPREEILRAFDLFDSEGKGRIELDDLRRVARELGEGLQEEELQAMIEEFDVRGEGGVDRDTFNKRPGQGPSHQCGTCRYVDRREIIVWFIMQSSGIVVRLKEKCDEDEEYRNNQTEFRLLVTAACHSSLDICLSFRVVKIIRNAARHRTGRSYLDSIKRNMTRTFRVLRVSAISGRGFLGLSQNGISNSCDIVGAQCQFIKTVEGLTKACVLTLKVLLIWPKPGARTAGLAIQAGKLRGDHLSADTFICKHATPLGSCWQL